jgi:hypothetical protein
VTIPMTRAARAAELSQLSVPALAAICKAGIRRPDGTRVPVSGAHPVSAWKKDEIVEAILAVEYPAALGQAAGVAGLTAPDENPEGTWKAISARGDDLGLTVALAQLAATAEGRAALATSRRSWAQAGLEPPWPRFVPVPLADAVPPGTLPGDAAPLPDGTTASRCTICGEIRISYPDDFTDPWKHHPDHCPDGSE